MKINKKEYIIDENEFKEYSLTNFPKLKLLSNLDFCEILIGLISDLCEIDSYNFIYNETKYKNFILSNIKNVNKESKNNILYSTQIENFESLDQNPIMISKNKPPGNVYFIPTINHYIGIADEHHDNFINNFKYYIVNNEFHYNNLINLVMIVKNAGDDFYAMLKENINIFDRYTIVDTGSTDNTINIIKEVLKNKKGILVQEPFINFRESRNRSLELAGHHCKFNLILDDTYIVQGNLREFLTKVRSDQVSDSFSIYIKSDDVIYCSNRIIKSETNLRYIYKIHEVISDVDNMNILIPAEICHIFDYKNDYMNERTMNRKEQDIIWLNEMVNEDPENPRHHYYLAHTYKLLKQYEKAEEHFLKRIHHKNEGFKSELIDACFELARLYNFELNHSWEDCLKYYMMAYQMDTDRPDSLYFIGIHYLLNNDIKQAHYYMKEALNKGFPLLKQYSLKPTLSYYYLPKNLVHVCYNQKDYDLGIKATDVYLKNNKVDIEHMNMTEWNIIFKQLKLLGKLNKPPMLFNKKIICFIADGGYFKWNGTNIDSGLGGSEKYIVMMAKYMKKNSDTIVMVFCNTNEFIIHDEVQYIPLKELYNVLSTYYIDICIISRYSFFIPLAINSYVDKIYVVSHDIALSGSFIINSPKLKKIICLTDWHKSIFIERYPNVKDKVIVIGNGIDNFYKETEKKKFKFIYSSAADRGLLPLLNMWNDILLINPEAELHCYCDLNSKWIYHTEKNKIERIKSLLPMKNVYIHGWVGKVELEEAWNSSHLWLYPCTFEETFCITALEAAMSKTLVITNNLAGLNETVGNRGIIVYGDATTENWKNQVLDILRNINNMNYGNILETNYNYALNNTWEIQAKKMLHLFDLDNTDARDTFIWVNQLYL